MLRRESILIYPIVGLSRFLEIRSIAHTLNIRRDCATSILTELSMSSSSGLNEVLARGYYTEQLENYFRLFSRDRFLILIFEETVGNHQAATQKLSTFLQIDPNGFDLNRMQQKVNPSYLPRMPSLYSSAVKMRQSLVKKNLGRVLTAAEKLGLIHAARQVVRFRGPRSELPKMDEETRKRLNGVYLQEIHTLEKLLGQDLSTWRN